MSYIDNNTKLKKNTENRFLINDAISYINQNDLKQYLPYFISSEGTDALYSKDYNKAIKKISEAIR